MNEDDSMKHEGKWTRDDLPRPDAIRFVTDDVALDLVVDHLNAHHPKPESPVGRLERQLNNPDEQAQKMLHMDEARIEANIQRNRAIRERDAALARAERAEKGAWRIRFEQAVADLLDAKRERDEWKARAEAAERSRGWFRDRAEAAEARTAPTVTKADIEKVVIEWDTTPTPHDIDTDLRLLVDQLAALLSSDDPAVHVVRESDVAAVGVEQDSHGEWFADGEHVYTNGAEDARNLATGHLRMAVRRLAVARAIEAEQATDPVEALADEFKNAAQSAARVVVESLDSVAPGLKFADVDALLADVSPEHWRTMARNVLDGSGGFDE